MITYEAAVLRFMPDRVAGEFANIALVMLARKEDGSDPELLFRCERRKLKRYIDFFHATFQHDSYSAWREAFEARCGLAAVRIQKESLTSKHLSFDDILSDIHKCNIGAFHWSDVSAGIDEATNAAFDRLYVRMVTRNFIEHGHPPLSDKELWEQNEQRITTRLSGLIEKRLVHFNKQVGVKRHENFHMHWVNGRDQFLEPLSLAGKDLDHMKEKTDRMAGRLYYLSKDVADFRCTILVAPPASVDAQALYAKRKAELQEAQNVRAVIEENELDSFIETIAGEVHQ